MKKLILSDIIKNAKLFLGTLIAITITIAIVGSCLSLVFSAKEQADYGHRFESVNVVVAPRDSVIIQYQTRDNIQQDEKELEAKPSFDAEQLSYLTSNYSCVLDYTFFAKAEQLKYGRLAGHNESSMALSNFTIIEGKRPQTNEVLIDKKLAVGNTIAIGDAISIKTNRETRDYIVSGIIDSNISGIYYQQNYIFFEESTAIAMSNGCLNAGIVADDIVVLSESLEQKGFRVYTGKTINYGEVPEMINENTALLIIFFTMGALCLVISMVVISGTIKFGIKHRLRSLALLRVLGFTKEQIKKLLIMQSGMLCMIGGILGVLLSFPLADFILDSFIRIGIADKDLNVFHTLLIDGIAIAATLIVVLIVTAFTANKPLSISPISAIKDEGEQDAKSTKAGIIAGAAFSLGGVVMLISASFNGRNGIAMSFLTSCLFLTGAILFSPAIMRWLNWLISAFTKKMHNSLGEVANANIKLKATRFAVASISIAIMMSLNGVMMLNDMTYLKSNAQTQYKMVQDSKYVTQNVSQREIKVKDYLGMKNIRMIIRNINHLDGIYGLAVNNIAMMNIQLLYGKKSVEPGQIMLSQNVRGFSVGQEVGVWFPDGYKAVFIVSGIFVSDSDKTEETVDCIINDDLALNHTYSNEYDFVYYNEQMGGSIENTFEYYTNNPNYDVQMGASLLLVGISIILSVIALYNTFAIIMSVRRKEFNGLKVIGASKSQIIKMTLIETIIVVGTGMIIGLCIIIPVVGKFSVDNIGVFDFIINWQIFIGMCLASAALGLTAGMIPSFLTILKLKQQFRNE